MGGGLMQLVAYGAQDIYLTGNPQITFFKVVYRRHTNFAMESIEQTFNGSVDYARKLTCTLDRNGDLVHKMYLEIDLSGSTVADINSQPSNGRFGHSLINEVEVEIGGQSIDKHYGEWLEIWSQLTCTDEELTKLRLMIDGSIRDTSVNSMKAAGADDKKMYVPLQFWFNRNPGLALPLIALQYHEVKINILLNSSTAAGLNIEPGNTTENELKQISLFCDYIFLDTDERRRFAQVSHEYLIEQLQFNNIVSAQALESQKNVELRFNHPCKELIWVAQPQTATVTGGNHVTSTRFDFNNEGRTVNTVSTEDSPDTVLKAKLQLNGHDRFRERDGNYFRTVQLYQHHTGGHRQWLYTNTNSSDKMYGIPGVLDGSIYCYSFALKPEEHQPSGTCNFSRIDNAVLQLTLNTKQSTHGGATDCTAAKYIKVYAINYNVLRIMSGMGGLAYSN